ncbi:hypothetical protein IU449_04760 [Nocardia higoensis]|uniref:Streptogramin lyase n=1 Tax=Nocardia higoensis TaxID=228599 RepID=A0ABS0D5W0_9NOCA|nr:hypothetical protein [Nocardia higoensis]MBF6353865.1 hypothetical protein [Nocardia higoensis]
MRPGGPVSPILVVVASLLVLTGCGSDDPGAQVPTREPATAAPAPATTVPPAGDLFALPGPGSVDALLAESGTGLLAALDTDPGTSLLIVDPAAARVVRTVTLPAPGAALSQGVDGEILVPARDRVLRVDAATGAVTETAVDGDLRTALPDTDGGLVVGDAEGRVRTVTADGQVRTTVTGMVTADVVVRAADRLAVLDRRQTSLTEITPGQDHLGLSLRAGDGAVNMIADHFGRVLVADTAGSELLVYSTGPLVLRQRFPVRSSPYALAYDRRSETVWVTCTQSNEVVGFDLSTGIGQEVGRHPTVRQPDAVTVDERTGDLFVGSAAGDGLQRIPADELKEGQ